MNQTDDAFLHGVIERAFAERRPAALGVAVSGGGDSMALLGLVHDWATEAGVRLAAVTLDHGLRAEAAAEAAFVAEVCAARGIVHDVLRWDGWTGQGNLQAEARLARYRLIAQWARAQGVEVVCLGHTRDDQAETFLMRLARKAGSDGLCGMAARFERDDMAWQRPLLGVGRAELRAYLRRNGMEWVEDPSNEDAGYDRVKARKALELLAPLGIEAETLSAVADNLATENALLRAVTRRALAGVEETHGALSVPRAVFDALHPEVRRRFLLAGINWIAGGDYAPRRAAVAALEAALLEGGTHVAGGVIGWLAKGHVWLARELAAVGGFQGMLFDGRWRVEGVKSDQEIRPLGEAGLMQCQDWRETGLPRRVFLPLPGVWQGDQLRAAPLIVAGKAVNITLNRPSFAEWLNRH
ncbi:tRNA lysidine(34) synthetase TilS [Aquicoccus sp. G2-2]|uniref:tRNA lysidine(34) synthetase TilS n=1 Tax=Aquicoccus sp. G2-2 TaxID=3092120 RepID=UPI002ADFC4F5|nr:tRNA lysidine(34) synthetase TilS [Aquicoccus sp. G2-2]MEA1112190.1 tRNA lysidine(34) synthetase TilS [Aquicoccus sp. G2-2]